MSQPAIAPHEFAHSDLNLMTTVGQTGTVFDSAHPTIEMPLKLDSHVNIWSVDKSASNREMIRQDTEIAVGCTQWSAHVRNVQHQKEA